MQTKWKGNSGSKWVPFLPQQISSIPCKQRTTYRDLEHAMDKAASTVHRHKKRDLGLFNHLQSKYEKTMPESIDKMVEEV
ncbi:Threonine--tRNA ligase [Bienertia sinuspersici]